MKKILIAAGGTGGHLYPGICFARELELRGCEIRFVTDRKKLGESVLTRERFRYYTLPSIGMPRKISPKLFAFFYYLASGFAASMKILGEFKPDAVIGLGGYVSFPVVAGARTRGMATFIHEQNYIPGLSNRLLGRIAGRVAVSFSESAKYFPKGKVLFTGNPVRKDLFKDMDRKAARRKLGIEEDRFSVLVFGGSQGAHYINNLVAGSLEYLAKIRDSIQFIHITGEKDLEAARAAYAGSGIRSFADSYMHEMAEGYAAADLAICRAGATTIAELIALRKPAVLIPFPHATGSHQEYNAKYISDAGAAVCVNEKDGTPAELGRILTDFAGHPEKIREMEKNCAKLPLADSAVILADAVLNPSF
jgi:UDP-N-acetylglucosamine--N-acetylmuramyl-(pentapeptide) pyrophosphoryl-undecaprenol N-acetylglucosamine transferase